MMEPDDDDVTEFIQYLLDYGALEIHGFDPKTESFTYRMTPKIREILPDFYEEHFKFVNQIAFNLWQKGYVEIKFEENGPLVMLIPNLDYEKIMDTLPDEERYLIENMISLNDGII